MVVIDIEALEKALRPHPELKQKLVTNTSLTEEEQRLLLGIAYMHGRQECSNSVC